MTAEEVLMLQTPGRYGWGGNYGFGGDNYGGYGHYVRDHSAQRATGIGFGVAGLAVAAIGVPLVAVLAKAFTGKAEAMAATAHSAIHESNENLRLLTQGLANEANNRQTDIRYERNERISSNPTTQNYIDLAAGAGAYSGAGANAAANAAAAAYAAQNGGYGRGGQVCPQPVALYQPAMPCRCNTCGD